MAGREPSGITIRPAIAADLPALLAIGRDVRLPQGAGAPDPAELHLRTNLAAGECFIAMVDGRAVGYAVLHYRFFHSALIDTLLIRPPHRRQGVGSALVRYLADIVTSPRIWTSTNLSNTPMQALLAAEGFRMSGFIEGLDEGDPELIYSRGRGIRT